MEEEAERSQKRPNLLKPWPWTCSLWKCDKINVCSVSHPLPDTLLRQPQQTNAPTQCHLPPACWARSSARMRNTQLWVHCHYRKSAGSPMSGNLLCSHPGIYSPQNDQPFSALVASSQDFTRRDWNPGTGEPWSPPGNFLREMRLTWRETGISLMVQIIKNLPVIQETWIWFLGWEDPLKMEGTKNGASMS